MTALVFLVFDVEVVFLYPWAVQIRELHWPGPIAAILHRCTRPWPSLRLEKGRIGMGMIHHSVQGTYGICPLR